MDSHRRVRRMATLVLSLGLVVVGCGTDSTSPQPTSLSQEAADDIAMEAAFSLQLVGGDLEPVLGGQPLAPAGVTRMRPVQALFDTSYTYGELTYEASRTYYDALDVALPGYGPTAVRIHWTSRANGTRTGPRDTAEVKRAALLDVRGIQQAQDTLRFDGTNTDTLLIRFLSFDSTEVRYFHWISTLTLANVRILKSTLETGFQPLGGTLTLVVSVDRLRTYNVNDIAAHYSTTVVITFTGGMQADIVVDGRYRYHWDLGDVVTRA